MIDHFAYDAAERQRERQLTVQAREAHLLFLKGRGASANSLAYANDRFAAMDRQNIARSMQVREARV